MKTEQKFIIYLHIVSASYMKHYITSHRQKVYMNILRDGIGEFLKHRDIAIYHNYNIQICQSSVQRRIPSNLLKYRKKNTNT